MQRRRRLLTAEVVVIIALGLVRDEGLHKGLVKVEWRAMHTTEQ